MKNLEASGSKPGRAAEARSELGREEVESSRSREEEGAPVKPPIMRRVTGRRKGEKEGTSRSVGLCTKLNKPIIWIPMKI